MGKNGAGKTTLLKMVAGALPPDAGEVQLGASLKLGYFARQALDLLDPDLTIEAQLQQETTGTMSGLGKRIPLMRLSADDAGRADRQQTDSGLVAMIVLAIIYAKGYKGGSGASEGFRFGLLLAIFVTGFVSLPIYASFNIDAQLGMRASAASFVEMLLVGTVLGVTYRPAVKTAAVGSAL